MESGKLKVLLANVVFGLAVLVTIDSMHGLLSVIVRAAGIGI